MMKEYDKIVESLLSNMEYISNTLIKLNFCTRENVLDVLHDTYLRIKKTDLSSFKFETDRKTANYIIRMAKNVVIDQDRRASVDLDYHDLLIDPKFLSLKQSTTTDHSEIWVQIVHCAAEILPEKRFELFKDLFIDNKSEIAISESRQIPPGSIRSDKKRMLEALKNNEKFKQTVSYLYQ